MITLYIPGTAVIVDGVSVDYIVVESKDVDSLLALGWVKSVSEIKPAVS